MTEGRKGEKKHMKEEINEEKNDMKGRDGRRRRKEGRT